MLRDEVIKNSRLNLKKSVEILGETLIRFLAHTDIVLDVTYLLRMKTEKY